MSTSQSTANRNLDDDYGSGTPATIFVCLTTTAPDETGDGSITQPTGGQYDTYTEVEIPNDSTHWPAASAGSKHNGVSFNFPVAGAGSTNNIPLTHIVFRTAATVDGGGRIIDALPLPAGTVVTIGEAHYFPIGAIVLTES